MAAGTREVMSIKVGDLVELVGGNTYVGAHTVPGVIGMVKDVVEINRAKHYLVHTTAGKFLDQVLSYEEHQIKLFHLNSVPTKPRSNYV